MDDILRTIILQCPSCGANLEITPDMTAFACGYCSTQQMVQRRGGSVSLKLIGEAIARVQRGTDRTASELAIRRIQDELAVVEAQRTKLQSVYAAGDTITGYWITGFVISLFFAIRLLYVQEWLGAYIAAQCTAFATFFTCKRMKICWRRHAHSEGIIEARVLELRRQLAIHNEVVSS